MSRWAKQAMVKKVAPTPKPKPIINHYHYRPDWPLWLCLLLALGAVLSYLAFSDYLSRPVKHVIVEKVVRQSKEWSIEAPQPRQQPNPWYQPR